MSKTSERRGEWSLKGLTTLMRAIERMHSTGEVTRRSGVVLERALHPVLFVIADRDVTRINDLATDLGLEASTVSRHVSKLVERGLAVRDAALDDRRASAVRLTPAGLEIRGQLQEAWRSILADAAEHAGIDEPEFGARFTAVALGMAGLLEEQRATTGHGVRAR